MNLNKPNSVSTTIIKEVIKLLETYPSYCDEMDRPHICIGNNNYLLSSTKLKDEIFDICLENELDVGTALVNKVIHSLSNRIRKSGNKLELDYRIAKDDNGNFLYQLTKNEMVVISDSGYDIVPFTKPIFKPSNTFKEQVKPIRKGRIKKMLDLYNLEEDDKFLILIVTISYFIPGISKIMLGLIAEKGTGKTTISKGIKKTVDPSPTEVTRVPRGMQELEKRLASACLICFDNIPNLSSDQQDALSRAITGDAYERNSDDTTYVSSYTRPIILNGIKCPIYKDDLMDRSILLEPKKIEPKDRLNDDYINDILTKEMPYALSYIFDIIARARVIKKDLKLGEMDRMADFDVWGCCIAEAIEPNGAERFKRLFKENRAKQNTTIINNNQLALAVKLYVYTGCIGASIELSSEEMFTTIRQTAWENNLLDKFPKGSNWFVRELKSLIGVLEKEGIKVITDIRKNNANYIRLERIVKE